MSGECIALLAAFSWGVAQGAAELIRSVRAFLELRLPNDRFPIIGHPWYTARDNAREHARACAHLFDFEFELPAVICETDAEHFATHMRIRLCDASWPSELAVLQNHFIELSHAFGEVAWILLFDPFDDARNLSAVDSPVRDLRKKRKTLRIRGGSRRNRRNQLRKHIVHFEHLAISLRGELVRIEKTTLRSRITVGRLSIPSQSDHSPGTEARRPALPNDNDERDAWIYELFQSGKRWREILEDLAVLSNSSGWENIATIPGVREAMLRYIERKNLPKTQRRKLGPKGPRV